MDYFTFVITFVIIYKSINYICIHNCKTTHNYIVVNYLLL